VLHIVVLCCTLLCCAVLCCAAHCLAETHVSPLVPADRLPAVVSPLSTSAGPSKWLLIHRFRYRCSEIWRSSPPK
jgi:hypothetical protein